MPGAVHLCAALLAVSCLAGVSATPDVTTIVRRSVEANLRNSQALQRFNYFRVVRKPDGTSRTFEELMLSGSRYSRLTAIDGKPLPLEGERTEERKLEAERQRRARESPDQSAKRVDKYERERERDQFLLNEMANAFEFTLAGEEQLGAHEVYVVKARPRRGYRPPNNRAKVLTGMEGTLWIDKDSFQWVRVEAEVIHPVSIEGFLATVQRGTRFELVQAPVSEEVWLPTRFSMKAKAKILFFFSRTDEEDESYHGYYLPEPAPKTATELPK